MRNKKSAGSLEVVLLLILVVILAGSLIYVLITNNKPANNTDDSSPATESKTTEESDKSVVETPKSDILYSDATKAKTEVQIIYDTNLEMIKKVDPTSYESAMAPGNYMKQYLSGAAADVSRLGHTGPGLGSCWAEVAQSIQFTDSVKDGDNYKVSGSAVGRESGQSYPIDVYYNLVSGKIVDYR